MTKEKKKRVAETIRDFYLYPCRSAGANFAFGGLWGASWFFGIVLQKNPSQQALGSTYFIFALSLLMDAMQEGRTCLLAKLCHSLFRALLVIMLFGAVPLIFWDQLPPEVTSSLLCVCLVAVRPYVTGAVLFMLFGGAVVALCGVDKWFYDGEAVSRQDAEAGREEERRCFQEHLEGPPKGGDT